MCVFASLIIVDHMIVNNCVQSLKSRGYVRENFTWRHYYWILTNEGIQYLRDCLHLPPEIVPATLKRQARPSEARQQRPKGIYSLKNCGDFKSTSVLELTVCFAKLF